MNHPLIMITKEDLDALIVTYEIIEDAIQDIFNDFCNAFYYGEIGFGVPTIKTTDDGAKVTNFSFCKDYIHCEWTEYWSRGGTDSGSVSIPLNFLYDEDAFAEWCVKKASEKAKQIEEDRIAHITNNDKEEYKLYLQLKDKFDNVNS